MSPLLGKKIFCLRFSLSLAFHLFANPLMQEDIFHPIFVLRLLLHLLSIIAFISSISLFNFFLSASSSPKENFSRGKTSVLQRAGPRWHVAETSHWSSGHRYRFHGDRGIRANGFHSNWSECKYLPFLSGSPGDYGRRGTHDDDDDE